MIVTTLAHARHIVARFLKFRDCSVDTETQPKPEYASDPKAGLIIGRHEIKIWSLAHRGESYSFPTRLMGPQYPSIAEWGEVFKPLWLSRQVVKLFHNFNYDGNVFLDSRTTFSNVWDTLIGCHSANANYERSLKSRANLYGRYLAQTSVVDFSNLEELAEYAEGDVIVTDEMGQMQRIGFVRRPKIIHYVNEEGIEIKVRNPIPELWCKPDHESLDDFHRLMLRCIELPILRATIRAEQRGVPVSRAALHSLRTTIRRDNFKILTRIYSKARKAFKIGSNQGLAQVLQSMGVELVKRTKKGALSVDAEALFLVQDQNPIVADVIKHKQNSKLLSVYVGVKGLERYMTKEDRIHPTCNTVGARTGRTSYQNPNLQTIPSAKDTYGIRAAFEAPKGKKILCLDFSQVEIRIMAIYSKDKAMTKILRDPEGDIHQETAEQFQVARSPVAKQINFLELYAGMSFALARKLTLEGVPTTPQQAQVYIDRYNEIYGGVRECRKNWLREHQRNGFVRYLLGNKRYLLDVDWSNKGEMHKAETVLSNNLCQGGAQQWLKCAIVRADPLCINPDRAVLGQMTFSREHTARLRDYSFRLEKLRREFVKAKLDWALQVHDENLYFVDTAAAQDVAAKIADIMTWIPYFEPITSISVPIRVEGGVGDNWKIAKGKTPEFSVSASGDFWE